MFKTVLIKILKVIKLIIIFPYLIYTEQFNCDIDKIIDDELK